MATRKDQDMMAEPKTLQKIGKLRSGGMSFQGIANRLIQEDGIKTGYMAVKRAYEIYSTKSKDIVAGDNQLKTELQEVVLDTKNQLKLINESVWEVLRNSGKDGITLQATREILKQLEFQEKMLNRMEEGFDFRKANKIEITQIVVNSLESLEKAGYIKILNKPGETINLEKMKKEKIKDATFSVLEE